MLHSIDLRIAFCLMFAGVQAVLAGTPQTIAFPEIPDQPSHAAPFALEATTSSGLAVSYSVVSPAGVATLAGSTMTLSLANDDRDENPASLAIQGAGVAPEIGLSASTLAFGNVALVGGTAEQTVTITNSGTAPLNLIGTPQVLVSGAHAADFTVTTQPSTPVAAAGGMTTFTVRFDPSALGVRSASLIIANDDSDENPYILAIQGAGVAPEIGLGGNSQPISSGDLTPSTADDTDFGEVLLDGGTVAMLYTITNSGTAPLNLTGTPKVVISGTHAAEFSVTTQPLSPVATGTGFSAFIVLFNPAGVGLRSATVSIANDDSNENPYTFAIQGTGIAAEIAISGHGTTITAGDLTPSEADHTDFGSVALLNTYVSRTFTVASSGTIPLHLTGTPKVGLSGAAAQDFDVLVEPQTVLATGASTTFTLRFDPSMPGLRTAIVSIANDDPDQNPYTFAISGFGALSTPHPQTITLNAPGTVYLGQSPVVVNAQASSGLPVTLSVVSGPATLTGNALALTGVGTVKVQATQPGGDRYAAAPPVTRTLAVKANPSALTLTDLAQRYDGSAKPIGAVDASGRVEIAGATTYKIEGVEGTLPPVHAGRYPVKVVLGGVTRTGTLVISKAPLWVRAEDKRKFAGEDNPELTFSYGPFQGTDTAASAVSAAPKLTTQATQSSPGGLYAITPSGGTAADYTFIHQRGMLVVESFAGGYEALLADPGAQSAGKLSLTVSSTSRSFTGQLLVREEKSALRFSGALTTDAGSEWATGTATVTQGLVPHAVSFTLPLAGDWMASVTRDGQPHSAAADGKKLSTLAVPHGGAYTVVLGPPDAAGAGLVPLGAGWAAAKISTKGGLVMAGRMNDGTPFTSALSADAEEEPGYRWFAQPYSPLRTEAFVAGAFNLQAHPNGVRFRRVEAANLSWKKTGVPGDAAYRDGFGPLTVVMTMDPWQRPTSETTLSALWGLTDQRFNVSHSATNSSAHQGLPALLRLNSNHTVSLVSTLGIAAEPTPWKMKLNVTKGTFSGSFVLQDAGQKRTVPFSGVLRQPSSGTDELIGDGHYLLPALPDAASNEKASGEVLFWR